MAGLNKVFIMGNMGTDPEIKYLDNGTAVAKFSVAANEVWYKDGEKQERTEWFNVVAFGRSAEILLEYCGKGSRLFIEGRLQTRSYGDEGDKRYFTEVVLKYFTIINSKKEGNSSGDYETPEAGGDYEDDIPF